MNGYEAALHARNCIKSSARQLLWPGNFTPKLFCHYSATRISFEWCCPPVVPRWRRAPRQLRSVRIPGTFPASVHHHCVPSMVSPRHLGQPPGLHPTARWLLFRCRLWCNAAFGGEILDFHHKDSCLGSFPQKKVCIYSQSQISDSSAEYGAIWGSTLPGSW